jgi:hypothetical protein
MGRFDPQMGRFDPQMGRFDPQMGYLLRFDPFQPFHLEGGLIGGSIWRGGLIGGLSYPFRAMTYLFTCRADASASESEPMCGLDNDLIGGASDAALYLSTKC